MKMKTSIFAILAIFCVILSAGAICAEEFDGGYAGANYEDTEGYSGSQYQANEAGSGVNDADQSGLEPGAGLPLENQTAPANTTNTTNTTNATNTTNTTPAAGGDQNATNPLDAIAQTLHATGNPILILVLVCIVLGGAYLYRRK